MRKYIITVNESDAGNLSVAKVDKIVGVNQHRSDAVSLPKTTFAFGGSNDPTTLTKRAARRSR